MPWMNETKKRKEKRANWDRNCTKKRGILLCGEYEPWNHIKSKIISLKWLKVFIYFMKATEKQSNKLHGNNWHGSGVNMNATKMNSSLDIEPFFSRLISETVTASFCSIEPRRALYISITLLARIIFYHQMK